MSTTMTNLKPDEVRSDDHSRRVEAEETARELERIRESYLAIRRDERDRLDRIIEGCKDS